MAGRHESRASRPPRSGVCGRVCPAPCMESCNRNLIDEGIDVRQIERFAGDSAQWPVPSVPLLKQRVKERVAVVGAGPAGISAAYQLASESTSRGNAATAPRRRKWWIGTSERNGRTFARLRRVEQFHFRISSRMYSLRRTLRYSFRPTLALF